jgi:16S rRNA (guanine527-N7)-methyltransferase
VLEIGSGGGFPGIILACARPDLEIVLLESRRRKVSFLRAALRAIGLAHATALEMRAEEAAKDRTIAGRVHAVIGRGLRLESFLALAAPLLADSGEAIAMQTPRTSEGVTARARVLGLQLVRRRTYRLHRYGARTLLFFARRPVSSSVPVC